MRKFTLGIIIILVTAVSTFGSNGFTGNLLFTAKLDGAQETPSVTTEAIGVASFMLNSTHDSMCVNVSVTGLSGPITSAHIHEGKPGVPGPVIISLAPFINGNRISTTLTGTNLTFTDVAKFMDGSYYINLHTTANPAGEIRGQIYLEKDYLLTASLNAAQVSPPLPDSAYGLAVFNLYQDSVAVIIDAKFANLSGVPTAAYLHLGAPGVNGPIVDSLNGSLNGNGLHIEVDPRTYITDLLAGNIYLSVYTTLNPNGEIRGQVLPDSSNLTFDAFPNGAEETPPNVSPSTGVGIIKLSPTFDTLYYDIVFDTLRSTPTAAHLHNGIPGVPGPVLVNLAGGLSTSRDSGIVTGASITLDLIDKLLEGDMYINIHNDTFPGGEIRGQIGRYAREGLTYDIDAQQETPPTSSSAAGSGFASIDRFRENIHFMLVASGLSGPVAGSHFHQAVAGVPGSILFQLDSFVTQLDSGVAISGYWTDDDAFAFDSTFANIFLSDSIYVNLHTSAFPGGEIRGQLIHGASCFFIHTGIQSNNIDVKDFLIYPNPATSELNLQFTATENEQAGIVVSDIEGRELTRKNITALQGQNKTSVSLSALDNGMYLLRLYLSGNEAAIIKFIKQ